MKSDDEVGMCAGKQSALMQFRLTPEDLECFKNKCLAEGVTASEVLKSFVQKYIEEGEQHKPTVPVGGYEDDPFVNLSITLRKSIKDGVFLEAKKTGISASKFISYLAQSALTRAPVLTDYELAAVLSSRRELKSIGRNLNQITKSINEASKMGMPLAKQHLLTKTHLDILGRALEKVNVRISKMADARYWVWGGHE